MHVSFLRKLDRNRLPDKHNLWGELRLQPTLRGWRVEGQPAGLVG